MKNNEDIPKVIYSCDDDYFIVELTFAFVDDISQIIYIDKDKDEFSCGDLWEDGKINIYEEFYSTKEELINDWIVEHKKFVDEKKQAIFEIETEIYNEETGMYLFKKRNNLI